MKWNRDFSKAPSNGHVLFLVKFVAGDFLGVTVGHRSRYGLISTDIDDNPLVRYTPVAWMRIPGWDTEDCFEEDQPDSESDCEQG